jgi:hypothetical protein
LRVKKLFGRQVSANTSYASGIEFRKVIPIQIRGDGGQVVSWSAGQILSERITGSYSLMVSAITARS